MTDADEFSNAVAAARSTEAGQQELERLRTRLHDTTLQTLEFIASGGMVGRHADMEQLMRLAAREATDLREYLEGFLGDDPQSVVEGLRRLIDKERAFAEADISLVVASADGSVRGIVASDVLSATREALTNVRKHARASHVVVFCEERTGTVLVTVKDDGVGMCPATVSSGLGIRHSIKHRMQRLGGVGEITSEPGGGTLVALRVPVGTDSKRPAPEPLAAGTPAPAERGGSSRAGSSASDDSRAA